MKLLKYFPIISAIAFAFVAIILTIFYRQTAIENLIENAEQKNEALTQLFANSLWPEFEDFVENAHTLTPTELQNHPDIDHLSELVLLESRGLTVVKVKVYDTGGLTAYSTDYSQIGEVKDDNEGFATAFSGITISELTYNDTVSTFDNTLEDRDVFSSYVPIYSEGEIVGVFEVYDDVTLLVEEMERTQRNILIGVVMILGVLYIILYIVNKRADTVIEKQYQELLQNEADLSLHKANLEHQVEIRTLALRDANKTKDLFLAKISHELRTPLNAVIGYSEMILEDLPETDPELIPDLERIEQAGRHLLSLVDSMLDISKIELDHLELIYTSIPFDRFLLDISNYAESQMKLNNNRFVRDFVDLPASFMSDETRVKQILFNLIGNAAKFTAEGTITLTVWSEEEMIYFEVADTGIGIDAEKLPYIFDLFVQADDTLSRQHDGVGLGLAIAKQLSTLLGGVISVTSKPQKGTTFLVKIPARPAV